jgi:cell division protein FtsN
MARDYKNTPRSRSAEPPRTPGWVWMIAGLGVGLFVAFLVYLHENTPAEPRTASAPPAPPPASARQDTRDVRKERAEPIPSPGPRFDFYTVLPEMEVVIPEQSITGPAKEGARQMERPGTYVLQAGAFRRFEEADRLKASLALLGIQSRIETVTNDQGTWHRVRVGPYSNLEELNAVRARLRENAINAVLFKVDT